MESHEIKRSDALDSGVEEYLEFVPEGEFVGKEKIVHSNNLESSTKDKERIETVRAELSKASAPEVKKQSISPDFVHGSRHEIPVAVIPEKPLFERFKRALQKLTALFILSSSLASPSDLKAGETNEVANATNAVPKEVLKVQKYKKPDGAFKRFFKSFEVVKAFTGEGQVSQGQPRGYTTVDANGNTVLNYISETSHVGQPGFQQGNFRQQNYIQNGPGNGGEADLGQMIGGFIQKKIPGVEVTTTGQNYQPGYEIRETGFQVGGNIDVSVPGKPIVKGNIFRSGYESGFPKAKGK